MSEPDIVTYLPASALKAGTPDWSAIKDRMIAEQGDLRQVKNWATKKYKIDFGLEAIRRAAEAMDAVPDDFARLLDVIAAATRPQR